MPSAGTSPFPPSSDACKRTNRTAAKAAAPQKNGGKRPTQAGHLGQFRVICDYELCAENRLLPNRFRHRESASARQTNSPEPVQGVIGPPFTPFVALDDFLSQVDAQLSID